MFNLHDLYFQEKYRVLSEGLLNTYKFRVIIVRVNRYNILSQFVRVIYFVQSKDGRANQSKAM